METNELAKKYLADEICTTCDYGMPKNANPDDGWECDIDGIFETVDCPKENTCSKWTYCLTSEDNDLILRNIKEMSN